MQPPWTMESSSASHTCVVDANRLRGTTAPGSSQSSSSCLVFLAYLVPINHPAVEFIIPTAVQLLAFHQVANVDVAQPRSLGYLLMVAVAAVRRCHA